MYHIHIVAKNLKTFTQTVLTFAGPKKCVFYRNNIRVDLAVFPPRVKLVSQRGSQNESLNKQFEWVTNMTNKIRFNTILWQPAELYLSVYSIVITFVASGTWRISERIIVNIMIINDIHLLMGYCCWGIPYNIVESRNIRYAITIF